MSTPVEEIMDPLAYLSEENTPQQSRLSSVDGLLDQSMDPGASTQSAMETKPKEKKRVGFTGNASSADRFSRVSYIGEAGSPRSPPDASPHSGSPGSSGANTPMPWLVRRPSVEPSVSPSRNALRIPDLSPLQTEQIHQAFEHRLQVPTPKPKPAIRPAGPNRSASFDDADLLGPDYFGRRESNSRSAQQAFERGKRLERDERSEPNSGPSSPVRSTPPIKPAPVPTILMEDNPLDEADEQKDDNLDDEHYRARRARNDINDEAFKLVKRHVDTSGLLVQEQFDGLRSGAVTPIEEKEFVEDYQPQPTQYRGSILGALLKLYNQPARQPGRMYTNDLPSYSDLASPRTSPPESGTVTPVGGRPWYSHRRGTHSTTSLAHLVGSSSSLSSPVVSGLGEQVAQRLKEEDNKRPSLRKRRRTSTAFAALNRMSRSNLETELRITVHIAETIARQKYLLRLCRALMHYGAPTHRLEEYMRMSARVLETDAQFLYIPGAMIMSFDDVDTHTTEVKLVKQIQGLDLGKLRDVHEIYKEVVHDRIGVEEATQRLKEVQSRGDKHSRLVRIFFHGFATLCVGPYAFGAQLIDLPLAFFLGCIVGTLQLVVAPASDLYANVFEVSAAVITSFLARAFGSIRGGNLFCFSALAQSSIALILPGYLVLCASLELQSRSIVAGSVRMVYAIIYSLFLGFGITIGTAIYGLLDPNATSAVSCNNPVPAYWAFFFVPGFALSLVVINQAKWKQAPVMIFIAFTGYVVDYFSARRFVGNTQIANSLSALAIGVQANLYSRIGGKFENWCLDVWEDGLRPRWKAFRKKVFRLQSLKHSPKVLEEGNVKADNESTFVRQSRRVGYSLAAAAMLPAIFVQVPSGLAVNGSLISGIASANQITGNATNGTQVVNATTIAIPTQGLNDVAANVGYSVIQVAIGITVGLFLSAIVVYPVGKRRSGLFSF